MKKSDRIILLVLPVLALVVGFYLLAISPKQKEIGELDDEIATLEARISDAEAQVATAEAARKAFPRNYAQIVSMGSAVPEDSDQATLIYDLTRAGDETDVHFRSFEISDDGAAAEAVAAPPATTTTDTTTTDSTESGSSSDGSTASTTTDSTTTTSTTAPVTATETAVATLPIGATVGSAGLPVMPYKLRFSGSFFDMADFFASLDKTVDVVNDGPGDPQVDGRLMTINGFAMVGDPVHGFPLVQSSMSVNTYVVPGDQGLDAGATPAGPAPVGESSTSVTSTSASTAPVPSTAAVSP